MSRSMARSWPTITFFTSKMARSSCSASAEMGRSDMGVRVGAATRGADRGLDGPVAGSTVPRVRLLVVEDEVDLADALARGLRHEGYAVDVAHDGVDALERLGVTAYDLVCLDLNLPDVDGLELCRRLRTDPAYAPDRRTPRRGS